MKIRTLSVAISVLLIITGCQGQNRGIANSASSASTGTSTTTLPSAMYSTMPIPIGGSTTVKTLTWNLATQMQGTTPVAGGGTISVTAQEVVAASGEDDYLFGTATVTGGSSAILVQNVGFMINGATVPLATVLIGVNRMIPANASRVLSSTTQLIPVAAFGAADTIALTFGQLTPTVFNPPTYTQLKSATGVFGASCIRCHSSTTTDGGLDLTNYANIIDTSIDGYFPAVAYNPSDSLLIMVMTQSNGKPAMPTTGGLLPTATTQQVFDWISDGAPNN